MIRAYKIVIYISSVFYTRSLSTRIPSRLFVRRHSHRPYYMNGCMWVCGWERERERARNGLWFITASSSYIFCSPRETLVEEPARVRRATALFLSAPSDPLLLYIRIFRPRTHRDWKFPETSSNKSIQFRRRHSPPLPPRMHTRRRRFAFW